MQENRCICCGAVIPEGMQVCPECRTEQEDEVPEYSFIVLQKEGQEERKEMPIILSFLIAAGKYMLIGLAWMALEKHFYGEVQPRIVDDIIGLILFFYILKGEILQ
jgi:RNA polymerase subunit RPABC4/transcription elongation factor Spt4